MRRLVLLLLGLHWVRSDERVDCDSDEQIQREQKCWGSTGSCKPGLRNATNPCTECPHKDDLYSWNICDISWWLDCTEDNAILNYDFGHMTKGDDPWMDEKWTIFLEAAFYDKDGMGSGRTENVDIESTEFPLDRLCSTCLVIASPDTTGARRKFCETCECKMAHCVVAEWSEWSRCSEPCGDSGVKTRTRKITTEQRYGGDPCPSVEEEEPCNRELCPVDCLVSEWKSYGECDRSCGGGVKRRQRIIEVAQVGTGRGCPELIEEKICNTGLCVDVDDCGEDGEGSGDGPPDCWDSDPEGVCNPDTLCSDCTDQCGHCAKKEPSPGQPWLPCHFEMKSLQCNADSAVITYNFENFLKFGFLDNSWVVELTQKTNGRTSTREITNLQGKQQIFEDLCSGETPEGEVCIVMKKGNQRQTVCRGCTCPPVECEVTEWSGWSTCSRTCGERGNKVRQRGVLTPARRGGPQGDCNELREDQACRTRCCPVDCVESNWEAWAPCSRPCGTGTKKRTRRETIQKSCGGNPCGDLEQTVHCNQHACPKPIKVITKDAVTNRPLSGVSVQYEFKDYRTTVTTSSGKATVTQSSYPAGRGPMKFTATKSGYISAVETKDATASAPEDFGHSMIISLSPVIVVAKQMRIVMNWGVSPRDLDIHVLQFGARNCHCYYSNTRCSDELNLDTDNTSGGNNGAETITIDKPGTSKYLIYVHDYSNGSGRNVRIGHGSQARINIYASTNVGGDRNERVNVPYDTSNTYRYWIVGCVDGSRGIGSFVRINRITNTSPNNFKSSCP